MEAQVQEGPPFNLLAFGMMVILAGLTWTLPRRRAICPLLAMTCLMPLGQELVICGLHFYLFRLLILVGLLRVFVKGEARQLQWRRTDKLFVGLVAAAIVCGLLAEPSIKIFRNRLGEAYNALGCYFFIRCVIVDYDDIVISVRMLARLSLLVAALMLIEKLTSHNLFSAFGGVPEIAVPRDGHLRCQGPFRHPILAGTFGATQMPFFVALWFYDSKGRLLAAAATLASLAIVFAASSSGALMAVLGAMGGLVLWRWRAHMRLVRRGAVVALVVLALLMKAPVWYLFDRLSSITGGTGWHRAYLIDMAIAHFNEWWLVGTTYTAHWGPNGEVLAADPNMMDITNHYIVQGVEGGLLQLGLFLAIIIVSFKGIGRFLAEDSGPFPRKLFVWAMGVSLFAHCLSFVSATYFDQTVVVWYWLLAIVCQLGCLQTAEAWPSEPQGCGVPIGA